MLSQHLKQAIDIVTQQVLPDLLASCDECGEKVTGETLAEVAIDAGRLTMFGWKEADDELKRLYEEHGYQPVFAEVVKVVEGYV
jgi:hypothetical protein